MARSANWPKMLPVWTTEQAAIADDFMRYWHDEVLPSKYGAVERFNHNYVVEHRPALFARTLEVGAGLGDHIKYERLTTSEAAGYTALELRENMAAAIKARFPDVRTHVGDIERGLEIPDSSFDRVIAIHVLEHLPDLPRALAEIHRLLDKRHGVFSVVIPCEGGLGYSLARSVSSARVFKRRYGQSYRWFIEREHINSAREVIGELKRTFTIQHRRFFPLGVPLIDLNLCIGLTLRPRA